MQNKFGSVLKNLRTENKMSQSHLAKAVGVTQQCISEWEQCKIEPTLSNLCALSEIFGVSIDFLAGKKDY